LKNEKPDPKIEIKIDHENENENEVFIESSKEIKSNENENSSMNRSAVFYAENNNTSDLNLVDINKGQSVSPSNSQSSVLCIKVNKNKDFINCPLNRKMKNRIESEFWFQINDSR